MIGAERSRTREGSSEVRIRISRRRTLAATFIALLSCIILMGGGGYTSLYINRDARDRQVLVFDPENKFSGFLFSNFRNSIFVRLLALTITGYDTSQTIEIPSFYDNFANVWDTITVEDQPALFYIPKSGGSTLQKLFSHCLDMVTASRMALTDPKGHGLLPDDNVAINIHSITGARYVNVDPSTPFGLARAASFDIVKKHMAKVIISQHLYHSALLYDPNHRGRLFVMIRNPIKRAIDQFYYMQRATWEHDYSPEIAMMSLDEYTASDHMVENYVVRSLLNKKSEDITPSHVETAKHILRRKFLVGLMEWFDLSVVRFEQYFGWWDTHGVLSNTTVSYCHHKKIMDGNHNGKHPMVEPGSLAYRRIAVRNWADFELYFYAKNLFYRQAVLV
eukprot:CAMPEP_0183320304 /NCGR_PEP_ID=MMETSP0160_2-20130417/65943_1 /TAXON_ID=2839 ORGANISM="Odontella Sinensis, Strain Grunow 1884" /NCGR_SAMPLE_ID=MMETSP0160_2 /ASSEMBLY_ACC=CAM_ASM_000250 /LENGTH=391 /DNA_ID=CAMNT_0025486977 /DNA_START=102 /DNA_END=1277 /DNA_ORIENTATION=-